MNIIIHPKARQEIDVAAIYYEIKSKRVGWNFYSALESQFQKILDHPLAYPRVYSLAHRAPLSQFHITFTLN